MTRIAAARGVLAEHRYDQDELTDAFVQVCATDRRHEALLRRFHRSAQVKTRHLALPLEQTCALTDFGAKNDAFIKVGTDLGARAVEAALSEAGLTPADVDLIVFSTVTGVAAPSLDARIAGRVGLRPDVKRLPLFGLGCVAGASGIARLHDYLTGHPDGVALLVTVELCSLTIQRDDTSVANLVASGLFGDGAAAVVAVGANRSATGPEVVDSRAHLYPNTHRTMGWDVGSTGLTIVLDAEVPALVEQYLADDVRGLLDGHGLSVPDVAGWVCHPGGPKVIEAITTTLGLNPAALEVTWRSLAEVGNLSSASVLHVLADTLDQCQFEPGSPGVLMAMGPGFCSELVLLRW